MAAYYPRRVATIKDLQNLYKGFDEEMETWDDNEEDRLEHIVLAKQRGKGAPKKKKSADGNCFLSWIMAVGEASTDIMSRIDEDEGKEEADCGTKGDIILILPHSSRAPARKGLLIGARALNECSMCSYCAGCTGI